MRARIIHLPNEHPLASLAGGQLLSAAGPRRRWRARALGIHLPPIGRQMNGRSGVIRKRDPLLPKQMRYQAALRSVSPTALHVGAIAFKTTPLTVFSSPNSPPQTARYKASA